MNISKYLKRLTALLLCALLALGGLPLQIDTSIHASAHWASSYVEKLQGWGVMQGYGNGNMGEDDPVTRAQMAALLNRTFGFKRQGPIPFRDVPRGAWYYDDISIAYTEGIMNGVSNTMAAPNAPVTREQALVFIGRALRLDQTPGEITEFTDGHKFSSWSGSYARSAVLSGIISGMGDGSFRPQGTVTRGQLAKMLSVSAGTLINTPGAHSLGGIFGNVTINTNNVTLRDTVIAGDLYLTGGVALGDVVLDNVRVLGRIVVAGGGESESAEASILLNNVTAQKLKIDPATGQYVSLRALGSTDIAETVVNCPAYIQDDVRDNSKGLRTISLEGPSRAAFTLAGNLKKVINRTPGSTLTIGDTGTGSATSVTIDEVATGSQLVLDINAAVDEVNLDTATRVSGSGDIGTLNVSTNGSSSTILPDEVVVRPGVVTTIKDMTNVDSEVAKEISADPRLLEGYPKVKNVAPTSADGYFSVNKAGTLYWALTNAATGPLEDIDAENMISPSDYGSGLLKYGNINITASKTEYSTRITGLSAGGTYYLSAVLVDAHGRRSPVKSQKILTPDGTTPALVSGYPTTTDRTPTRNDQNADIAFGEIADIQATVMANKSCDLYYVLLASGSTAPQTSEFLSASFVNPYGYGRIHVIKNTLESFKVNEIDLNLDDIPEALGDVEENTSYDLYLWLTDADGSRSSKVTKHTIKTKDITPPEFNMDDMLQTATQATSVRLSNSLNEAGTVYWVAVPNGSEYPQPKDGMSSTSQEFLRSDYAKLQVIYGQNAPTGSKTGKVTARANVDFNINITGLPKESAYDVYYLAVDSAGNYSDPVRKYTAHTLDSTPPTATQEFENAPEDSPSTPYADSTINVVFSEDIRYKQPSDSTAAPYEDPNILNLYRNYTQAKKDNPYSPETKEAEDLYVNALRDMIILYDGSSRRPVAERTATSAADSDWTVDYRNVRVYKDGPKLVVSFINNTAVPANSALNLQSGARYYFQLKNIADESDRHNTLNTSLPIFTTVSAQVIISKREFSGGVTLNAYKIGTDGEIDLNQPIQSTDNENKRTTDIPIDIGFVAKPRSTSTTADNVYWDMLLWFDTSVTFELFTRVKDQPKSPWVQVGDKPLEIKRPDEAKNPFGTSIVKNLGRSEYNYLNELYKTGGLYCGLNDAEGLELEYAVHFTKIGNNDDRSTFSQRITGQVTFVTGSAGTLSNVVANSLNSDNSFDNVINERDCNEITFPKSLTDEDRLLTCQFSDGRAPELANHTPLFDPTDNGVTMSVQLSREGNLYYVLAAVNSNGVADLPPQDANKNNIPDYMLDYIAKDGFGVLTANGDPDGVYDPNGEGNGKTLNTSPDEENDNYKFVYPNSLSIYNPKGNGLNNPLLITGSREGLGNSVTPINIDGLKPDTLYYVYVVTQGMSDVLSEVKVFQFRTNPVTRPVIELTPSGSNIRISSDIDANVNYLIVPYIENAMDAKLRSLITLVSGDSGLTPPSQAPMPVYEAMGGNVTSGTKSAGSWFDCYDLAENSPVTKDDIADYIRSSVPNGSTIVGAGEVTVQGGRSVTVNCARDFALTPGIEYMFLVVGQSTSSSANAFRAYYSFHVADETAPLIYQTENTLVAFKDANNRWCVRGELVLIFDEPLWYVDSTSGKQNLYRVTNAAAPVPTGYTSSSLMAERKSTGVQIADTGPAGTNPQQATSLTINFSESTANAASGASVTFFPGLSDSSGNARMDHPLSVSVRVTEVTVNGEVQPKLTINIQNEWLTKGLNPNA